MSEKRYRLGLILGRFQGIHKGHETMIDTALSISDRVCVLVGSSEESGSEKNPFDYETRRRMLERIYGDRIEVYPIPDIGVGNCAAWGEYVISTVVRFCGETPDILISGKEQRRTSWLEGELGSGIAELYIPKSDPISATRIREFFSSGDKDGWMEYTNPALYDMFEELALKVASSAGNAKTKSI